MRTATEELPVLLENGPVVIRAVDWGGQRVLHVSLPAGLDARPLLAGLPDDMCPCPHWGYLLRGRIRVEYTDGTAETVSAGDLVPCTIASMPPSAAARPTPSQSASPRIWSPSPGSTPRVAPERRRSPDPDARP